MVFIFYGQRVYLNAFGGRNLLKLALSDVDGERFYGRLALANNSGGREIAYILRYGQKPTARKEENMVLAVEIQNHGIFDYLKLLEQH